MTIRPKSRSTGLGFSLVELLVVLAIISILVVVGFNSLEKKSPRQVQGAIRNIKSVLVEARSRAISSGRTVTLTSTWDGNQSCQITGTDDSGASVLQFTLDRQVLQICSLTDTSHAFPASITDLKSLEAVKTYGFGIADPWDNHLLGSTISFSPSGALSSPSLGLWVGAFGKEGAAAEAPCALVLVSTTGRINGFYKAKATDSTAAWQRLD